MSQLPHQYKEVVLAELKKQLPEATYMEVKPLIRNAKTHLEIYELAKKYAKDLSAIRKQSFNVKADDSRTETNLIDEVINEVFQHEQKSCDYGHQMSAKGMTQELLDHAHRDKTLQTQIDAIGNEYDLRMYVEGFLDDHCEFAEAEETTTPNSTRADYEFGGKAAGSLFSKAELEADFRFDLTITVKKDKEASRSYRQLKSMELRGLINVNEETWAKIHKYDGGKHVEGDYKYEWTKSNVYEKIGDEAFAVTPKKDSSEKDSKK